MKFALISLQSQCSSPFLQPHSQICSPAALEFCNPKPGRCKPACDALRCFGLLRAPKPHSNNLHLTESLSNLCKVLFLLLFFCLSVALNAAKQKRKKHTSLIHYFPSHHLFDFVQKLRLQRHSSLAIRNKCEVSEKTLFGPLIISNEGFVRSSLSYRRFGAPNICLNCQQCCKTERK